MDSLESFNSEYYKIRAKSGLNKTVILRRDATRYIQIFEIFTKFLGGIERLCAENSKFNEISDEMRRYLNFVPKF